MSSFLESLFGFYGRFNRVQYASTIVISDLFFFAWLLFCSVLIYNALESGIAEWVVRTIQMIGALLLVVINVAATTRRMRDVGIPPWVQVCPWTLTVGTFFCNQLALGAWFLSLVFFVALSVMPGDAFVKKMAVLRGGHS